MGMEMGMKIRMMGQGWGERCVEDGNGAEDDRDWTKTRKRLRWAGDGNGADDGGGEQGYVGDRNRAKDKDRVLNGRKAGSAPCLIAALAPLLRPCQVRGRAGHPPVRGRRHRGAAQGPG